MSQLVGGAVITIAVVAGVSLAGVPRLRADHRPGGLRGRQRPDPLRRSSAGWHWRWWSATVVGLLALLFVRRDLTAAYVVVAGLVTGVVAALISAPISANVFGGVTGAGTDFLVAAFRQAGADIGAATLGQGLISDPVDKIMTFFVVYLVLNAMARRTKARFPQGERLIEGGDEVADGGR